MTVWRPLRTDRNLQFETHQTLAAKEKSPDGAKMKYNGCLHNQDHFLAMAVGGMFYFFFRAEIYIKTVFTCV